jgi:hypothetical protein
MQRAQIVREASSQLQSGPISCALANQQSHKLPSSCSYSLLRLLS